MSNNIVERLVGTARKVHEMGDNLLRIYMQKYFDDAIPSDFSVDEYMKCIDYCYRLYLKTRKYHEELVILEYCKSI